MAPDAFSAKRWDSMKIAERLRNLREERALTQKQLAEKIGVTETAVRNYELRLASPTATHLKSIADALDVRPETLRLYDFTASNNLALNAIFQIADTYGLEPGSRKDYVFVSPTNDFMGDFIQHWSERYSEQLTGHISRDEYEIWKEGFSADFDPAEFPNRYAFTVSGKATLIEQWEAHCMSIKLQRLRKQRGMKQSDLARLSGCTIAAIRSYEQAKRLPKQGATASLAHALHVTADSLTFFDFESPVQAAHALFQLSAQYGLGPDIVDSMPILRTHSAGLERGMQRWAEHYALFQEEGDLDEFLLWRDEYDEDRDRGSGFESRYRAKFAYGKMVGFESDFDPYISAEQAKLKRA